MAMSPHLTLSPTPTLTFHGPQSTSLLSTSSATISLVSPNPNQPATPLFHVKTSKHSKPNVTITRLSGPPNAPPLATATFHTLTSSIDISFGGSSNNPGQALPPLKLSQDWTSVSLGARTFHYAPRGLDLKWRARDALDGHELRDSQKRVLARYKSCSGGDLLGTGPPVLEVFVVGADEALVDMVVVTAVSVVRAEEREVKKVMKILGDLG
ncbi:uncharacterized protein HMPREF1541_10510 [Cyphellophora europaea CBS 101466]|uniref:DUF6593 domain-containing protein n=1 Tax=Cyphellophora europaea (strain CBS 101466) TaxID=1220924 RepID=W2S6R6_CYPE1|nr:uncharacterized protein HMPREF1541_10510 [Cyphellophora europaea CBS 101466]ETN44330.1 hypothetical protein HMPREF1541_10510 [Cyphellophora europaea CBS 101466]